MQKQSIYKLGTVLVLSVFMAACAGKKSRESVQVGDVGNYSTTTEDSSQSGSSMNETIVGGVTDGSLMGTAVDGGPAGIDGSDPLGKRTIFFDYNSATLTSEGNQIAQAHGQYLASNPQYSIMLEGHADERGTAEYNLALAEERAKIVEQIFATYGVNSSRIQIVSYGEERPVAIGHDEAAYGLNRRVEMIYQ